MRNKNQQHWLALWQRIGAHGDPHAVYNDLVTRYSESHRAYHTLAHIQHCLDEFEQVRHLIANPDAVELALWYHDAIYDTKAKDNEEKKRGACKSDNSKRFTAGRVWTIRSGLHHGDKTHDNSHRPRHPISC